MQALDGPEHRAPARDRLEGLHAAHGAAASASARAPPTHACIDAVAARGHCEFVRELAAPVPLRIIADMLGLARRALRAVPALERRRTTRDAGVTSTPEFRPRSRRGSRRTCARWRTRRRSEPRDDLISAVVAAERRASLDWRRRGLLRGLRQGRPGLVRAVRAAGGQRDHAQRDLARHARADRAPRERDKLRAHPRAAADAPSRRSCAGARRCACCAARW